MSFAPGRVVRPDAGKNSQHNISGAILVQNVEVARAFYELADLLEIKGEDFFKIKAYRRAARAIAGLNRPVEDLYRQNKLSLVPGIGRNITAKVGELIEKGKIEKLEKLRAEIPRGLLEIMALPGIGSKRAGFLYEKLGVTTLEDLERAARERRVRFLKGMGAKTEMDIIYNVEMIKKRSGKYNLGVAWELAGELKGFLEGVSGVERVAVAGGVRRWREVVEEIVLVAACRDPGVVLDALSLHPRTGEVIERGESYIGITARWGIPVKLVTVEPENFWFTLLWETGSEGHLKELARHADSRNWEFGGSGIKRRGGEAGEVAGASEEELYNLLDLEYIPPELREGCGEVDRASRGALPSLVKTGDIRGDLHLHSQWSDGAASIEEIAVRALEKGYSYVAITDHSQSLKVARGLSPHRLAEQYEHIDRLNREMDGITVLKGVEVDILAGGGLDFDDRVLEMADVVVASVHSGFKQDRQTITSRIMEAVENRHVDIIGHLTGRILGYREAYHLNVEDILEQAGKMGKIIEINSSPDRLDLNDSHARKAVESGVRIAINTDAHDLGRMDEIDYGVAVARRAGIEPRHIINTLELDDLLKILKA